MFRSRTLLVSIGSSAIVILTAGTGVATPLAVTSTTPARLAAAAKNSTVTVTFDRPVLPASITPTSFRVFGKQSGVAAGPFSFSNSNQTVTLTPSHPFAAGEIVIVNLSHAVTAADTSPLRSAGFMYQFRVQTSPASRAFTQIEEMSNRTNPSVHIPDLWRDGRRPQRRRVCRSHDRERDQRRLARFREPRRW